MGKGDARSRARERRAAAERRRAEEQRHGRRRRWLWGGATAATVAALAGVGWLATGPDEPDTAAPVAEFSHVHGVAAPEWSPEALLATHHGLLAVDAAGEWTMVSEEPHDFMGFSAHPTEDGVLYSSGHPAPGSALADPLGFMVSEDGGRTWEVRSLAGEVDFHAMAVGADGATVYAWYDVLHRSDDEGHTWERIPAEALEEAEGVAALAAHPEDPDAVWAATPLGLLHSTDGGATWEPVLEQQGPASTVHVDPADPDRLLAYTLARGLVESTDGGTEWTDLGWALADDAVGHVTTDPTNPDVIYAGTHAEALYRSDDGGASWEELASAGQVHGDPPA